MRIPQIVLYSLSGVLLFSCGKPVPKIHLSNPSSTDLTSRAISIEREKFSNAPENQYPVLVSQNGDTIASQLDDLDKDGKWDKLFFAVDIKAMDTVTLSLTWSKNQPNYTKRTNVRFGERPAKGAPVVSKTTDTLYADSLRAVTGFQPYQTDGPMWENDKVGFRHYFDGRNSKDLFGKKVEYISPDSVGLDQHGNVVDNYHRMWDWGRDILAVGNSVGIGGFGLFIGDSVARLGVQRDTKVNNIEKSIFTIVENGPVHSVMHFEYQNWVPKLTPYQVKEVTSIWPGVYAFKNKVTISGLQGNEDLLVGLVNIHTDKELVELTHLEKYVILYTHDMQTYDKTWYLGMALILPKEKYLGHGKLVDEFKGIDHTFYARMDIDNEDPLKYYAVACWELSNENFTDPVYFENYVVDLAQQLAVDVVVTVE
jgi:hypothetical protein